MLPGVSSLPGLQTDRLLLTVFSCGRKKETERGRELSDISSPLVCALITQSCPTLCDPIDCSLPGSSVHGILQARILEWVPIPSSRGSSQCRDQTHISCLLPGQAGSLPLAPPGKLCKAAQRSEFWLLCLVAQDYIPFRAGICLTTVDFSYYY